MEGFNRLIEHAVMDVEERFNEKKDIPKNHLEDQKQPPIQVLCVHLSVHNQNLPLQQLG